MRWGLTGERAHENLTKRDVITPAGSRSFAVAFAHRARPGTCVASRNTSGTSQPVGTLRVVARSKSSWDRPVQFKRWERIDAKLNLATTREVIRVIEFLKFSSHMPGHTS